MSIAATMAPSSPYKGLAAFDDTDLDALLFFGRTRETQVVAANVLASRLTVLYGPSGVGKSSLLRAGVVRALRREGGFPPPAVAVYGSWAGDPIAGLEEAARAAVAEALGREPANAPGSLTDRLAAWSAELGAEVCLMLDQLEELFLYHPAAEGAGGFVELLPDLVARPGLRVNVLLGIRDDALAQLDVLKGRIPGLFANSLRLDHLDRGAATAAILGPLERYNEISEHAVGIEPALVDAVLDEVETGKIESDSTGRRGVGADRSPSGLVETPYLQLVMQRVWEVEDERGSRLLRLETFQGLGGAQRIVEDHLERALQALTPTERDAAASVFGHLVTPSGTKIAHGVSDLATYASMTARDLEPVLRSLARERILRPLGENGHAAGGRYEIFHDVLGDAVLSWRVEHETQRQLERERRQAERRHRRVLVVAAVALVALAAMTAVAVFALAQRAFALNERERANDQARHASAGEFTAKAASQLEIDPLESMRLAVAGVAIERTPEAENILRQALLKSRLRRVFRARGPIRFAGYNSAGDRVAVVGADGTARVFDSRTGRELQTLHHPSQVADAAFSRDGRSLAAAGRNGEVRVWRVDTGALQAIRRGGALLSGVAFSRDSRLILAWGGVDGAAHVWSVSGEPSAVTIPHSRRVTSAVFTPDGTQVLTLAGDSVARIFSVYDGQPLRTLPHAARVTSAAFGPEGQVLVTGTSDGLGHIWYPARAEEWKVLRGHKAPIFDVAFSPSGTLVATGSADGIARVWSAATGNVVATIDAQGNIVRDVAFSPQAGRSLVTVSADGTTRVWRTVTGGLLATLAGRGSHISTAVFSRTGRTVLTAGEDGVARTWDTQTEPQLRVLMRQPAGLTSTSISPDGAFVVSGSRSGVVKVVGLRAALNGAVRMDAPVVTVAAARASVAASSEAGGVLIWEVRPSGQRRELTPPAAVDALAFSPDGAVLATGCRDGIVRLWNARTRTLIGELRGLRGRIRVVEFSGDGSLVLGASEDGRVRVWSKDGELQSKFDAHSAGISSAVFSPGAEIVATSSGEDRSARLWQTRTGRRLHTLRGHTDGINATSFSPDGRLLATASLDHDVRIWDALSGKLVRTLDAHVASVSDVAFSSDGRWIVTAGPTKAGLWRTSNGQQLFYLGGHGNVVRTAAFVPDGLQIVTSSADGSVRTYACRICGDVDELVRLATRRLARLQR